MATGTTDISLISNSNNLILYSYIANYITTGNKKIVSKVNYINNTLVNADVKLFSKCSQSLSGKLTNCYKFDKNLRDYIDNKDLILIYGDYPIFESGKFAYCATANSNDSILEANSSVNSNLLTISAFIKANSSDSYIFISYNDIFIYIDKGNSKLYYGVDNKYTYIDYTLDSNNFTHFAVSYNGTTVKLYENGSLKDSFDPDEDKSANSGTKIAVYFNSISIDQYSTYNEALNDNDILKVYRNIDFDGLVANTNIINISSREAIYSYSMDNTLVSNANNIFIDSNIATFKINKKVLANTNIIDIQPNIATLKQKVKYTFRFVSLIDSLELYNFNLLQSIKDYQPKKIFRFSSYIILHKGKATRYDLGFKFRQWVFTAKAQYSFNFNLLQRVKGDTEAYFRFNSSLEYSNINHRLLTGGQSNYKEPILLTYNDYIAKNLKDTLNRYFDSTVRRYKPYANYNIFKYASNNIAKEDLGDFIEVSLLQKKANYAQGSSIYILFNNNYDGVFFGSSSFSIRINGQTIVSKSYNETYTLYSSEGIKQLKLDLKSNTAIALFNNREYFRADNFSIDKFSIYAIIIDGYIASSAINRVAKKYSYYKELLDIRELEKISFRLANKVNKIDIKLFCFVSRLTDKAPPPALCYSPKNFDNIILYAPNAYSQKGSIRGNGYIELPKLLRPYYSKYFRGYVNDYITYTIKDTFMNYFRRLFDISIAFIADVYNPYSYQSMLGNGKRLHIIGFDKNSSTLKHYQSDILNYKTIYRKDSYLTIDSYLDLERIVKISELIVFNKSIGEIGFDRIFSYFGKPNKRTCINFKQNVSLALTGYYKNIVANFSFVSNIEGLNRLKECNINTNYRLNIDKFSNIVNKDSLQNFTDGVAPNKVEPFFYTLNYKREVFKNSQIKFNFSYFNPYNKDYSANYLMFDIDTSRLGTLTIVSKYDYIIEFSSNMRISILSYLHNDNSSLYDIFIKFEYRTPEYVLEYINLKFTKNRYIDSNKIEIIVNKKLDNYIFYIEDKTVIIDRYSIYEDFGYFTLKENNYININKFAVNDDYFKAKELLSIKSCQKDTFNFVSKVDDIGFINFNLLQGVKGGNIRKWLKLDMYSFSNVLFYLQLQGTGRKYINSRYKKTAECAFRYRGFSGFFEYTKRRDVTAYENTYSRLNIMPYSEFTLIYTYKPIQNDLGGGYYNITRFGFELADNEGETSSKNMLYYGFVDKKVSEVAEYFRVLQFKDGYARFELNEPLKFDYSNLYPDSNDNRKLKLISSNDGLVYTIFLSQKRVIVNNEDTFECRLSIRSKGHNEDIIVYNKKGILPILEDKCLYEDRVKDSLVPLYEARIANVTMLNNALSIDDINKHYKKIMYKSFSFKQNVEPLNRKFIAYFLSSSVITDEPISKNKDGIFNIFNNVYPLAYNKKSKYNYIQIEVHRHSWYDPNMDGSFRDIYKFMQYGYSYSFAIMYKDDLPYGDTILNLTPSIYAIAYDTISFTKLSNGYYSMLGVTQKVDLIDNRLVAGITYLPLNTKGLYRLYFYLNNVFFGTKTVDFNYTSGFRLPYFRYKDINYDSTVRYTYTDEIRAFATPLTGLNYKALARYKNLYYDINLVSIVEPLKLSKFSFKQDVESINKKRFIFSQFVRSEIVRYNFNISSFVEVDKETIFIKRLYNEL